MATSSRTIEPAADATRRGAKTRRRILTAATRQFSERGYDGAKFREIGDVADVSFQSIRYHFGTKEKLWEAVVEQLHDDAEAAMLDNERELAELPPAEQLRAQIRAMVAYQAEHPELQKILLREAMKGSERYRQAFNQHVRRFERNAVRFLGGLQDAGVIKPDIELQDLFYVFRGALNYRLVAPPSGDTRGSSRKIRDEVIERHAETITRLLMA